MSEENKNKIPQPLDLIGKLREVIAPLGYEIHGFGPGNGGISVVIGYPEKCPYSIWNDDFVRSKSYVPL